MSTLSTVLLSLLFIAGMAAVFGFVGNMVGV